jgi:hypothetical protein
MVLESWRDRLRWIIEHDGEYFYKWHISKSAISWTSKNRGMFSLLFGHPVFQGSAPKRRFATRMIGMIQPNCW